MNRREFIPLLGSAAAWPITARAQVRKAYRIGTLTSSTFESASHVIKVFEESMAELGYVQQDFPGCRCRPVFLFARSVLDQRPVLAVSGGGLQELD